MIEDDTESRESQRQFFFEILSMIIGDSAGWYEAEAKGLASDLRYYKVEVTNDEIFRCILNGLLLMINFIRKRA